MPQPLQFTTDQGEQVIIEIGEEPGKEAHGDASDFPQEHDVSWEAALQGVRIGVRALLNTLREGADSPDEVRIEFGIRVTGSAGAIIAANPNDGQFRATVGYLRAVSLELE